jgi:hypothetical protein
MRLEQLTAAAELGAKLKATTDIRAAANRNKHGVHIQSFRGSGGDHVELSHAEAQLVLDVLIDNMRQRLVDMGVTL